MLETDERENGKVNPVQIDSNTDGIDNIDSIILDVDGTLWDTTDIVAGAWNQALRAVHIDTIVLTGAMMKQQFGKTMDVIAKNLLGDIPLKQRDALMVECTRYEHEALSATTENLLYPGVKEIMQQLSQHYKLFIVSNCQAGYIELCMAKNQLEPYVTDIECYGNNGNSKGENIKLIVDRNHLQTPVYVGDTLGDQEAAEFAGVPFIYAAYGFGVSTRHIARIESFSQLATAVQPVKLYE